MEIRDKKGMTEKEFLENYEKNKHKYPCPFLTADLVVFTEKKDKVLLVKRGGHPFLGYWACPGGFVNQNEDARTAAMRELEEETGLKITEEMIEKGEIVFSEVGLFSKPGRDPRGWVVSDVYAAVIPSDDAGVEGSDDAEDARWFNISKKDERIILSVEDEQIIIGTETRGKAREEKREEKRGKTGSLAFDHDYVLIRAMKTIGII